MLALKGVCRKYNEIIPPTKWSKFHATYSQLLESFSTTLSFDILHHLQKCDQFSAELFNVDSVTRQVPVLCNSTISVNSTQSNQAANNFCSNVWSACQNVSIMNSPFTASLQGRAGGQVKSNITKLTDVWQSQTDFCNVFGGASDDEAVCFAGAAVNFNSTAAPNPPRGMCLEKIGNGSYLNMVPHPDGSGRAFFSNQAGKVWLATIPKQGSGGTLELDEANPFLDLTDEVHFDTELGMMGIAAHPKFATNGRFFVSYNCDKTKWPGCGGRCACNSDVDCDPSKLAPDSGSPPCQFQCVVAEYTVNGTGSQPSLVHIGTQISYVHYTSLSDFNLIVVLGKKCSTNRSEEDFHHGTPVQRSSCRPDTFWT